MRADRLASGVEECAWMRRSAGDGAKGPRVYDWAAVDIRPLSPNPPMDGVRALEGGVRELQARWSGLEFG